MPETGHQTPEARIHRSSGIWHLVSDIRSGDHLSRMHITMHLIGSSGPSSSLPCIWDCTGWGLPQQRLTTRCVRSYRTISPLPDPLFGAIGGVISVALFRGEGFQANRLHVSSVPTKVSFRSRVSRQAGITCHPRAYPLPVCCPNVLGCPDVPQFSDQKPVTGNRKLETGI